MLLASSRLWRGRRPGLTELLNGRFGLNRRHEANVPRVEDLDVDLADLAPVGKEHRQILGTPAQEATQPKPGPT